MTRKILLTFVVFAGSLSLWCQVEPSASGGSGSTDDDSLMTLPAPVSGSFYPSEVGSEQRENSLSGGIIFIASYDDNVLAGEGIQTIGAESYTILPNIAVSSRTTRLSLSARYSPGFMFFHPTSDLNEVTQNAVGDFSYRLTPHTIVGAQEVFQQNSTVFSQPYTLSGAAISGSANSFYPVVIAPYAGQILDSTNAHIGYQFSRNSMISASGYYSLFNFSASAVGQGFYNSRGEGGSGSYSRRFGRAQYLGLSYRYGTSSTTPYPSTTQSQFGSAFYSLRLSDSLSLSFSGGPEYISTSAPGSVSTTSWAPSAHASLGWQRPRTDFAVGYDRQVSTGWGLVGAFTADTATGLARWQFTQRLVGGLNGNYSNTKQVNQLIATSTPTGHTIFGRASLDYRLGEHLSLVGEYSRLHNSYSGIEAIRNDPDADRIAITLSYGFQRPLGQ